MFRKNFRSTSIRITSTSFMMMRHSCNNITSSSAWSNSRRWQTFQYRFVSFDPKYTRSHIEKPVGIKRTPGENFDGKKKILVGGGGGKKTSFLDGDDDDLPPSIPALPRREQISQGAPFSFLDAHQKFSHEKKITAAHFEDSPKKSFRGYRRTEEEGGTSQEPPSSLSWKPIVKVIGDQRLRIAVVGRANSGKSSLFNMFVKDPGIPRAQLVKDFEGVTRDCVEAPALLNDEDMWVTLVDTPGAILTSLVTEAQRVLKTCDMAIFVTSVDIDITLDERQLAKFLVANKIPTVLMVNKMDLLVDQGVEGFKLQEVLFHHYEDSLGLGKPIPFSVKQNGGKSGREFLLAAIQPFYFFNVMEKCQHDWDIEGLAMDGNPRAMEEVRMRNNTDKFIRVAIIGSQGTGKTALFNRLIGFERSRGTETNAADEGNARRAGGTDPGTRDAVDVACFYKGRRLKLIDTSALYRQKHRRKSDWINEIGRITRNVIQYSHVCIVCIDAKKGSPLIKDMVNCFNVVEEGRALVIAANKWDEVYDQTATAEAIDFRIKRSLHEIKYTHAVVCSSYTSLNLTLLLDEVLNVYENWNKHIAAKDLTRFWKRLEKGVNIPHHVTKITRLKQVKARPPSFVLHLQTKSHFYLLKSQYTEMVKNALAEEFGFRGVPLRLFQEVRPSHPDYI